MEYGGINYWGLIITLFCYLQTTFLLGQDRPLCSTYEYLQNQKKLNPYLIEVELANEEKIQRWIKQKSSSRLTNTVITIPVVVHVVYNKAEQNISDAQIRSQIEALNNDYRRLNADTGLTPEIFRPLAADTRIQFQLAQQDPAGNPTFGITRKFTVKDTFTSIDSVKFKASGGTDIWNNEHYLNIWVCNLSKGLLGYSQSPGVGLAKTDGLVINYRYFGTIGTVNSPFNLGRTTTHEVGHWLNLIHIWGDSKCGNDFVADTPIQADASSRCKPFPYPSCNNYSDMFMNYMDYSYDACMNLFTIGQRDRMLATLNTLRVRLLSSPGAQPLNLTASDERIFELYPNPTSGFLYLKSFFPAVSFHLKVIDSVGRIRLVRDIENLAPQTLNVDLSSLANGMYIVQIKTPELTFAKRIILDH